MQVGDMFTRGNYDYEILEITPDYVHGETKCKSCGAAFTHEDVKRHLAGDPDDGWSNRTAPSPILVDDYKGTTVVAADTPNDVCPMCGSKAFVMMSSAECTNQECSNFKAMS